MFDKKLLVSIIVAYTTLYIQLFQEFLLTDVTERRITKIAREAEKLVVKSIKAEGVGTAEIDFIHALRHNPGSSQARLTELLGADKAAIARRTKNLEEKGYLIRKPSPSDRRSMLLFPTEKAEKLKSSKEEIESSFYVYLLSSLDDNEKKTFAELLERLYIASKTESRNGFPHFSL